LLQSLSIKNYALIEELNVKFDTGFSVITGETGAGKSILLGALGLVLGKRADVTFLKNKGQKCIVEVEFSIAHYGLESFFEKQDLDFEKQTIIRREIMPSGKSRAFINDTPTTLNVLNALSEQLIDVHSQHQTAALSDSGFQFKIIDALASNSEQLASYQRGLNIFKKLRVELDQLLVSQNVEKQQYEYNLFLFNELELADLKLEEQEKIEKELVLLNNVETIKTNLADSIQVIENEEFGLIDLLSSLKSKLHNIASFSNKYDKLSNRIESIEIELKDVVQEIENENEQVVYSPLEIERLNDRLQLIYDLFKKHAVDSIAELLKIHENLSEKVYLVENLSKIIEKKELEKVTISLNKLASTIHSRRQKVVPVLIKKLEGVLFDLGMKNARFQFDLTFGDKFLLNGKDVLTLLFSSNKGENFGELKKIASGGELSRIMLAVKSILSNYIKLPTIIFDEIDTGVSGEISNKMGDVMLLMSKNMQVMSITHLPQIAGKGAIHYKVYKEEVSGKIKTQLKLLSDQERLVEIAEMLAGKNLSDAVLAHAKELLN